MDISQVIAVVFITLMVVGALSGWSSK